VVREATQARNDGVRASGVQLDRAAGKVRATTGTSSDRAALAEDLRQAVIALTQACNTAHLP
jgi:hypothetical protein